MCTAAGVKRPRPGAGAGNRGCGAERQGEAARTGVGGRQVAWAHRGSGGSWFGFLRASLCGGRGIGPGLAAAAGRRGNAG